jgi:hypothetical protein
MAVTSMTVESISFGGVMILFVASMLSQTSSPHMKNMLARELCGNPLKF